MLHGKVGKVRAIGRRHRIGGTSLIFLCRQSAARRPQEQAGQGQLLGALHADLHLRRALGRASAGEQPVPEAEDRAVVGIRVDPAAMMMNPMDRRRDDDTRQRRFQPARQAQVRVMEDGGDQQQGLEGDDRQQGKTQQQDRAGPGGGRDQYLAEMKAQRAGRIQGPVEVMDEMEAPEEMPLVIGPVPPIDQEIEQQQIEPQTRPTLPPDRTPGEGMAGGQRRQGQDHQGR